MPTSPRFVTMATAAAASLLAVAVLAGCSSSTAPAAAPTTTRAAAVSGPSSTTGGGSSGGTPDASSPSPSDSESHTGDSPILPAGATLASGEAPAARTVTISKDTTVSFNPPTLTIKAGDDVTFKGGDKGTYSIIVPGLEGATVTNGLIETFVFPKTGTFTITEDISATTMTITVT